MATNRTVFSRFFTRISVQTGFLLAACAAATPQAATAQAQRKPLVIAISLDALAAKSLQEQQLPAPTLHALMRSGSYASMQPINPTVTWPNHTTIVTGVNAAKHHVLANGLIANQRGEAVPRIDAMATKDQLVAVPTVYDAVHAAGMTTAEVDWVAIHRASSIDWSFAERPDPDSPIAQDLVQAGVITPEELRNFGKPAQSWRDRMYAAAAVDMIRKHHPNLLLVHFLALDSIEHQTGYGNDAGRATIAFLDDRVKEIVDAVRESGDLDRTTFLIVSDHGQQTVHHGVDVNAMLRERGLQGTQATGAAGQTYCINEAGFALLYQQHATTQSTTELKQFFAGKPGVRAALTPQEAANEGWPVPAQSGQAPDLLLYAADGYAFKAASDRDESGMGISGQHGYPNTVPNMQAILIASGAKIRHLGSIAPVSNLSIAPTIAALLGVRLDTADGKALTPMLQ